MIQVAKSDKRNLPHQQLTADLVVVGGGLSGVCCALAAARKGIKVVLVQDRPVLGGNASSEIRVWALGATSHMGNNNRWAREGGIIGEILVENLYKNKEGNPIIFDTILLDKVMSEKNITLLLNTVVYDLQVEEDVILSVQAFNPQEEKIYTVEGKLFCDASGDGIVSYLAGAPYRCGAEEQSEFGEGFSPSEEYGQSLGHTIFLYTKMSDAPVKYVAPEFALKDMTKLPKLNQIRPDQNGCNYWWFEYGGEMDTIAESETIKKELWRVVYGAWNHIKNSGQFPEAENLTLEWVGMIPGKRESRRFEGLYMLTQHDIVAQTQFPDSIAYGGWAIDLHPAKGVYSPLASCNQFHAKGIYEIPYRCYMAKSIWNLFFIGRLISASHVAFGSTRVMLTSALGGQAIGTAASICIKRNLAPVDLLEPKRMKAYQQQLCYDGQSIPHIAINQRKNLLKDAELTASSTIKLGCLPFSGQWHVLNMSAGMLLPMKKGVAYAVELEVSATADTLLTVELLCSEKPFNYTPDMLIEQMEKPVKEGRQTLTVSFSKGLPADQYGFIILRANKLVSIGLSDVRMTGILSVINKFNTAVNNHGRQKPPKGCGFEEFEFLTPDRRPNGKLMAMRISPLLDCFGAENVRNGWVRPYLQSNAWVAEHDTEQASLVITWQSVQKINSIRLYFDNDFDHPMETVQWNHPENRMPYCVRDVEVLDGDSKSIAKVSDNYRTIVDIPLSGTLETDKLTILLNQSTKLVPISLFELEIR